MSKPDLSLYIGQKVISITHGAEKWEWGIKLESGAEIRNKDVRETFAPKGLVNYRFQSLSLSTRDTVLHFIGRGATKISIGMRPTAYVIFDPSYGDEIYPQWPEELDAMGITANEGMAPPNPEPVDPEAWQETETELAMKRERRIQTARSNDTDDRLGRIVGVEDDTGRFWCFECADGEISSAGETAFMLDAYAIDAARKRCVQCGRRLGEVSG